MIIIVVVVITVIIAVVVVIVVVVVVIVAVIRIPVIVIIAVIVVIAIVAGQRTAIAYSRSIAGLISNGGIRYVIGLQIVVRVVWVVVRIARSVIGIVVV